MSGRLSVLSPRRGRAEVEDLAGPSALVTRQRIRRRPRPRRAARRARRLVTLLAVLAAVAAGLAGAVEAGRWLLTSPRFAVRHVEVRGQSRLDRQEVLAAAGIESGANLFGLDTRAIAARVESLPEVRRAQVLRIWPDRVAVAVEERRPFTLVHAGHLHWIDEAGVGMGRQSRAVPVAVPVISGLSAEELATARRAPSARVSAGVALIRTLLRSGSALLGQISEIDVGRSEGPVLYTLDGVEVRLGVEDWETRLPRLEGVLAQVAASGQAVTSIDLRFRDQVVLKPLVR